MKLYKYISFDKEYWNEPLKKGSLYFSNLEQLKQPNDPKEFEHHWDIDSHFFNRFSQEMSSQYNNLFSRVRILCLSKRLSHSLWNEYCGANGGICYEFDFTQSDVARDITNRSVEYSNFKYSNVPKYLIRNTQGELSRILRSKNLATSELPIVMEAMSSGHLTELCVEQIQNEIAFKKFSKFRHEFEYRFIHPDKSLIPEVRIKTFFNEGRISFDSLGLKLERIYISHPDRATNVKSSIKIKKFPI